MFIAYFIRMFDDGYKLTAWTIYGIFLLVLIAHGLLNTFGVKLVKILGDISVWWHVVGVGDHLRHPVHAARQHPRPERVFDQAPPQGLTGWTGGTFITIYLFALGPAVRAVHDHRVRRLGARQ